jgi:hypothetical protein
MPKKDEEPGYSEHLECVVKICGIYLDTCADLLESNMDSERLILAGAIEVLEAGVAHVNEQLEWLRANVNTWAATRARYTQREQEAAK